MAANVQYIVDEKGERTAVILHLMSIASGLKTGM